MAQSGQGEPAIYSLPNEILALIFSHLDGRSLTRCSSVSSLFHSVIIPSDPSTPDLLWADLVSDLRITTPAPYPNFRTLYNSLRCNLWLHGKVWHGNRQFTGYILIARYNPENGAIEVANLLATKHGPGSTTAAPPKPWSYDGSVLITDFYPRIRLWEDPLLTITAATIPQEGEIKCTWSGGGISCSLVRAVAAPSCGRPGARLWPPLLVPAKERTHLTPSYSPRLAPSEQLFRLRKWMMFPVGSSNPSRINTADEEEIFSALDKELYTPDEAHPFRGLWVGDYSHHGCEFILMHQPCPDKIEGIKITGDINIPRGECSFFVENATSPTRIADEPEWPGAKVLRASFQVTASQFRESKFIPSEMICIGSNELAFHLSRTLSSMNMMIRFRRVDLDEFIYGSGEVHFKPPAPPSSSVALT